MGFFNFFGFPVLQNLDSAGLPEIFPLGMEKLLFVDTDIMTVFSRILTDCVERTQGIPDEAVSLLWDNCLQSECTYGLISHLARAMTHKRDLFLVYNQAIGVVREATGPETEQIRADYIAQGESELGIFVSFNRYHRTDMIRLYTLMEYCVVSSLNKVVNVSKSIQFKMNDMRGSVSLTDSSVAINQAKTIAAALGHGKDIIIDKNDEITTSSPDISSIKESIEFLDCKRSFYYSMPLSYVNGEQTPGIGSTGEQDTRAVERGLKNYYVSVLKPVLEALFDVSTSFKSNDFRQIGSALEAIKTFELVSDDLISQQDKKTIIQKLFDIDPEVESE